MISNKYLAIFALALDIKSFARCRMTFACTSTFRSSHRRNSFRRSISFVKSETPDRMMILGLASQGEADSCGKMAVRVRKEVEDWIRKSHADKIG
jgi:hypothetical protein